RAAHAGAVCVAPGAARLSAVRATAEAAPAARWGRADPRRRTAERRARNRGSEPGRLLGRADPRRRTAEGGGGRAAPAGAGCVAPGAARGERRGPGPSAARVSGGAQRLLGVARRAAGAERLSQRCLALLGAAWRCWALLGAAGRSCTWCRTAE